MTIGRQNSNSKDEGKKTFTFSKTGTLPTLERLLGEMASLEEQTQDLEVSLTVQLLLLLVVVEVVNSVSDGK